MILESFPEACEGRTVILLHGGTRAEVAELQAAFRSLASQSISSLSVDRLPFITAPSPVFLFAATSGDDEGLTAVESLNSFQWRRTPQGWEEVVELLSPFVHEPGGGFQYLDAHGEPVVIYSTGRTW